MKRMESRQYMLLFRFHLDIRTFTAGNYFVTNLDNPPTLMFLCDFKVNSFQVEIMSSSKGSISRNRPQKHQNRTAFKNNLHDTSKKTKVLNSLEVKGVCQRCKDVIEWKIKYKKYKPLTVPAKCVGCSQKAVKYAYHILCIKCATEKKVCAKCCTLIHVSRLDYMLLKIMK